MLLLKVKLWCILILSILCLKFYSFCSPWYFQKLQFHRDSRSNLLPVLLKKKKEIGRLKPKSSRRTGSFGRFEKPARKSARCLSSFHEQPRALCALKDLKEHGERSRLEIWKIDAAPVRSVRLHAFSRAFTSLSVDFPREFSVRTRERRKREKEEEKGGERDRERERRR